MKAIDVSRYMNREQIEVEVEVLTPMFLGGADGNAELRSAPFKAAIRYWWRILYGGDNLRPREDAIFGSTDAASNVSVAVKGDVRTIPDRPPKGKMFKAQSKGKSFPISIIDYLCYGLYSYEKGKGNVYNKSHIQSGSRFSITVGTRKEYEQEVTNSLKAMLQYGGFGARSRNGMGSVHTSYADDFAITSFFNGTEKPFTSANKKARLFQTGKTFNDTIDALSEIGILYKDARNNLEKKHSFVRRGYVSRPIEVKFESIPENIKTGRHPKSYFLSIRKKEGRFQGQILYLPFTFYEAGGANEYLRAYDEMNSFLLKSGTMEEIK